MNSQQFATLIACGLLCACAGTAPSPDASEVAVNAITHQITGRYKYIDGDRFIYWCGGGMCADTLIRDQYLQQHAVDLENTVITISVQRVNACDDKLSSPVACYQSLDGSALRIVRWVKPAPKN